MFDELMKEAFEIPLTSRMRFLAEIQGPFGMPPQPVLNVHTAHGLLKIAHIIKSAQGDEQAAALELERQAMVDPQVQMALDYQQMQNERDEAMEQVRAMNQQLFDAQSAQAMADQQAQQMGQQVSELQGQIEQEAAGRQEAQQAMVAAKDQSLQEQMAVQDQKQQMNTAAQTFQEQANMLTQQLKAVAAQPTAPPPAPAGPPGAGGEMPPPATAGAAQEQQEAANAEQEAAIQGEQAQQASMEDQAKMEQAAAAQGGAPPEGAPMEGAPPPEMMPPPGMEMPKQGSDKLASIKQRLKMMNVARKAGQVQRGIEQAAKKLKFDLGSQKGDVAKAVKELSLPERAAFTAGKYQGEILGGAAALGATGVGAAALKAKKKRDEKLDKMKKAYFVAAVPIQHRPVHLDPELAQREGAIRGGLGGAAVGGLGAGLAAARHGVPGRLAALAGLGGAALGAVGGGAIGGLAARGESGRARERYKANLMARQQLRDEAKAQMAKTGAAESAMDRILKLAAEKENMMKCSKCGKMTKYSELGKCSACGETH